MHLPEVSANRSVYESVWSALSWEKRDVRCDDLPMMNSFLWPIGKWMRVKEQIPKPICIYYPGFGLIQFYLRYNGYRIGAL